MNSYLSSEHIILETRGQAGLITLNRAQALNALSLPMIRSIMAALQAWKANSDIKLVAIRGMGKDTSQPGGVSPFGVFCAGGDIRYFHRAIAAGDPSIEDFFTEEYALNHLIHNYPKPYIAFMDGVVMGGGMGISQGAAYRIVTERTKMAMPETAIGLFPDVGGGYFLSRCPGRVGEYLALTGIVINDAQAMQYALADYTLESESLPALWESLATQSFHNEIEVRRFVQQYFLSRMQSGPEKEEGAFDRSMRDFKTAENSIRPLIDHHFSHETVHEVIQSLESSTNEWAQDTAKKLRQKSPLMLAVSLEQIHRARSMRLADNLRMERGIVRHCFHTVHLQRAGLATETMEGIRATAVDKDHAPRWNPERIEEVTSAMVHPFFASPWPTLAHPLRDLL